MDDDGGMDAEHQIIKNFPYIFRNFWGDLATEIYISSHLFYDQVLIQFDGIKKSP